MKKLIVILASVLAAATLSVTASATHLTVSGLGTSVQEITDSYVSVTESIMKLNKNKTIKDTLVISEDEILVVPEGCTLALYGGCKVDGTLFIENGAKLLVKNLKLEINGSVVNDGYAFFGAKSSLSVNDGGMLYSSAKGRITVRTERVSLSEFGSTVCLGKGTFSTSEAAFSPSVVGAVKVSVGVGGLGDIYRQEIVSAEDALAIAAADYFERNDLPFGGGDTLVVLFSNGCTIKYAFTTENDAYKIMGIFRPHAAF